MAQVLTNNADLTNIPNRTNKNENSGDVEGNEDQTHVMTEPNLAIGCDTGEARKRSSSLSKVTKIMPKKNLLIEYLPVDKNEWISGKIVSRAGKSTGKYSHFWNVLNENVGEVSVVDFENDVSRWRTVSPKFDDAQENTSDEVNVCELFLSQVETEEAKLIEIS